VPSDGSRHAFLLSRVIEISNSNIQVENRLKYICDFLCRETGASCVCVYRREGRSGDLLPWVTSCMTVDEAASLDFRIPSGEGAAGKAAQKRAPQLFTDVRNRPPTLSHPRELRDFASILSVPVMDDVYLYGVMNVSTAEPRTFPEEEVRLMSTVATEMAGAVRNSRLYHDARKRVSELITLNEIAQSITSTFQVPEILGHVAESTTRLLQADACTIRLAEEGKGGLKVMVEEGAAGTGDRNLARVEKGLAEQIVREKRPLLVNGPEDSPAFEVLSRHGIRSWLGLPILSRGNPLGVISYRSASASRPFDMEVVSLMQTVCSQLANTVENASMYQEARRMAREREQRVRKLSTLYEVSRALMSTVKTERILHVMMSALTSPDGFDFSRAVLFLLSEDGGELAARMAMGPRSRREAKVPPLPAGGFAALSDEALKERLWDDLSGTDVPVKGMGCLVARAAIEKRPVRTETGCPGGHGGSGFCGAHPKSFAAVPLVVKGEARGVIYVDNRFRERSISEEDIQILTMFASEACLAMENASLYESLENALDTIRTTQDRLLQSEKLAALGEMAARIAHEIKNPLTVIGGFARRLEKKSVEEGVQPAALRRYSSVIRKEVARLEGLIQQTLYFSREAAPSLRSVDMNGEVQEVLAMFREEFEEARVTTVVELSPDLPIISVDPDQVRQVLWNLFSNAVHAMPQGGTLRVETAPTGLDEGEGVELKVGDTGGGIPHDVVHNIFNPFFTTKPKGTGLGLPIVHAIVERHGGSIHIDNREGKGVTFSVLLPRFPREPGTGKRILDQMRKGEANGSSRQEDP
jgi:signal transduction histidine kinase